MASIRKRTNGDGTTSYRVDVRLKGHPAERLYTTPRPEEELYDLKADPWELNNLAGDPEYADTLAEMRGILDAWIAETGDKGQTPETEEVYDADMAAYIAGQTGEQGEILKRNIAQMKAWADEGK